MAPGMKSLLPELLLYFNQSEYMQGSNINDNIRSILDVMDYTKAKNFSGILFFRKCLTLWNGLFLQNG